FRVSQRQWDKDTVLPADAKEDRRLKDQLYIELIHLSLTNHPVHTHHRHRRNQVLQGHPKDDCGGLPTLNSGTTFSFGLRDNECSVNATAADQQNDFLWGPKDKKGAKQQKFIKAVTHQVKFGQQNPHQVAQSEAEKKLKKDDKKKELQELNELFKPVVAAQKISKGADPKSVVCAFFKHGQCTKGDKCKFSHDLTLERKCEKRSIYSDARDEELEKDTMDNWDEKKLEEVVNKKHGITVASLERFSTYTSEKDENKLSDASRGRAENGERSDLEEDNEGEGQENGAIDAA
ncbi:hypothetical protein Celaphus_00005636, partial [Cervus elaphus hippelaphus]